MKISAILLMLLGLVLIIALGFLYLFGFAMSFDAPGSDTDTEAWLFRLLLFLPILVLVVVWILALHAFLSGNYRRSTRFGLVFGVSLIGGAMLLLYSSYSSVKGFEEYEVKEAEYVRLYPVQKYLRPYDGGADTIIVFPNGIVAYRLTGTDIPWSGPLGDLNASREVIAFNHGSDTKIKIEELNQFVDGQGRKFTEVYSVQ